MTNSKSNFDLSERVALLTGAGRGHVRADRDGDLVPHQYSGVA